MSLTSVGSTAVTPRPRNSRGRTGAVMIISLFAALGHVTQTKAQDSADDSSALGLAEALQIAEQRSASLLAQDASIRAARELAVAAGRLPDPVLSLSVDNLPVEGSNRFSLDAEAMTMRSLSLRQTYTPAAKRDSRSSRFQREAEVAGASRSIQLASLRSRTARAWLDRHYQERMLDLLSGQLEAAELTSAAVESAYRSNRVGQAQVLAARTASAKIKDRQLQAEADLRNTQSTLRRWVGAAAVRPLGSAPGIDVTRLQPHEQSHGLAEDLDQHPDLALMDAQERLAMAAAQVARAEKSADWTWSLKWGIRDGRFGDMVSIGVSIPLQWNQSDRQDRELAARLEQARRVRAEREEMRREHLAEVERMVATWRSNLQRLHDYEQSLIPLASDRTRAAEATFGAGGGSLASALEARRMEIDTRIERLRIERETALVWAELEFLVVEVDANATPSTAPTEGHQP